MSEEGKELREERDSSTFKLSLILCLCVVLSGFFILILRWRREFVLRKEETEERKALHKHNTYHRVGFFEFSWCYLWAPKTIEVT